MKTSIETIIETLKKRSFLAHRKEHSFSCELKENQTKEPDGIKELFGLVRGVVLNLGEKSEYKPKLTSRLRDFFCHAKSTCNHYTFLGDKILIDYLQHNIYDGIDVLFIETLGVYENTKKRFERTIALYRLYNSMPHGISTNYSHLEHFEHGVWEEKIKKLFEDWKQKN